MKNTVQRGEVITLLDSQLVHPSTRVAAGDPVLVGVLVGVAFNTTTASTDSVDVQRKGVFSLSVTATNSGGNSAVAIGDQLYIDGSTAVITKNNTKVAFGIALATVTSGATATIAVAVG